MYEQTPCVTIVRNPNTGGLEALMYYVGGTNQMSAQAHNLVRRASIALGGKGGILLDGKIEGNSGWSIDEGLFFLNGAAECGGRLANNSLAVNMDLLLDWNQHLQRAHSLMRGEDKTSGQQSLPGRLKNSNTSKSNIYFVKDNGVVFDNSVKRDPIKLSILYNGQGAGSATLGIGSLESVSVKLVSDSIQPDLFIDAGTKCNPQEEGKTVADRGIPGQTNSIIARSTLVCSKNGMLCSNGGYCYLTSIPNQITFRNTNQGIQDKYGQFRCPGAVPFAVNVQTGVLGGGQIYVFYNEGGAPISNKINAYLGYTDGSKNWDMYNGQMLKTDFNNAKDRSELLGLDFSTITGTAVYVTDTFSADISNNPNYTILIGTIGNYSTPVGYSIQTNTDDCHTTCSGISRQLGNKWQLLGTQRQARIGDRDYLELRSSEPGCGCERTDFSGVNPDNYNGLAVVIGNVKPVILSVTCSNMPLYYHNN